MQWKYAASPFKFKLKKNSLKVTTRRADGSVVTRAYPDFISGCQLEMLFPIIDFTSELSPLKVERLNNFFIMKTILTSASPFDLS